MGDPVGYYGNKQGSFTKNKTVFVGAAPQVVHGRKAILGDFDNNGWLDVVIAGHGYDFKPFRGQGMPILMKDQGKFTTKGLPVRPGFYHSPCAGDIDNDGDVDIPVTDWFKNPRGVSRFLINDGRGNFAVDFSLLPPDVVHRTSELYDLNRDGYLDLILAGHEMDPGQETIILSGNGTGKYRREQSTVLRGPAEPCHSSGRFTPTCPAESV